jgi:hypothetical protein
MSRALCAASIIYSLNWKRVWVSKIFLPRCYSWAGVYSHQIKIQPY